MAAESPTTTTNDCSIRTPKSGSATTSSPTTSSSIRVRPRQCVPFYAVPGLTEFPSETRRFFILIDNTILGLGRLNSHLIHGFWDPQNLAPKRDLDRFSRFCRHIHVINTYRQTYRHADVLPVRVTSVAICAMHAMLPKISYASCSPPTPMIGLMMSVNVIPIDRLRDTKVQDCRRISCVH